MPYTTVATNDVLSASHFNSNYRDQVIATVTSGTRPSGTEGQVIYETDTDRFYAYTGSGWVEIQKLGAANTYTPALTASTSNPTLGSGSTATGAYFKFGRFVVGWAKIVFGSSGAAAGSGTYRVSIPTTAASTVSNAVAGIARLYDSSSGNSATPSVYAESAAAYVSLIYPATWPAGTQTLVNNTSPWTWAASDELNVQFAYEGTS